MGVNRESRASRWPLPLTVLDVLLLGILAVWVIVAVVPLLTEEQPVSDDDDMSAIASAEALVDDTGTALLKQHRNSTLWFEENRGQVDERVEYLSRASHYNVFINANEVYFAFLPRSSGGTGDSEEDDDDDEEMESKNDGSTYAAVVRMHLVDSDPSSSGSGIEARPGVTHYFTGADASEWVRSVPQYGAVHYQDVYPEIDAVYYGKGSDLEFDFVVDPGADPDAVRLSFEGGDDLSINDDGELLITTTEGTIRMRPPVSYQFYGGSREQVASEYVLHEEREVGFIVEDYDPERPLIIDPVVSYTAIFSSSGKDYSFGVAATPDGDAFIAGETVYPRFPARYASERSGKDFVTHAFVAKVRDEDSSLDYFAFLGGDEYDSARGVAVDDQGYAYVSGKTRSSDFPIASAVQGVHGGGANDVFVSKLAPDGSELVFSTFLGGGGNDNGRGIAVDSLGNAYITGETKSPDFPVVSALQPNMVATTECFISKLPPNGESLVYSTFLGGSDYDACRAIAVDSTGYAYVTGATGSADFPTVQPAQSLFAGGIRVGFVSKVSGDGSRLVYSTFLGGTDADHGRGVAVDQDGHAYVTGKTASSDFPVVQPFQSAPGGGEDDAFVTKLSQDGSTFVYSSYLGGSYREIARSISVDSFGNAYVTGRSSSEDFPTVGDVPSEYGTGKYNSFLSIVDSEGTTLGASRLIGGSRGDRGLFIALDDSNRIYIAGHTLSRDFPGWREKVIYSMPSRGFDAFVVELEPFQARQPSSSQILIWDRSQSPAPRWLSSAR